jgi:molybdenum-dependent DNA-binding transcriptional regulator ModE
VYVLDLFAGYGSMRAAAKELGLSYVGVDERDLMHNTD